ncbi:MAG: Zn-dependent oligopeptidase [Proteobacteria bacterium]|nr:Zn-dependent oligopeptidase [Pseudomonadota bacterium]
MSNNTIGFVVGVLALTMSGCCEPLIPPPKTEPEPPAVISVEAPSPPEPPAEPEVKLITEPNIWLTVEDVKQDCKKHLEAAKKIKDELVTVNGERTLENTLKPLNNLYIQIDRIKGPSIVFFNVSPIKEVRDAAEECRQQAEAFTSSLKLDREVYDALAAVQTDELDTETKRFLERELRDYRHSGVDKDADTRAELTRVKEEMVTTAQEYSRAINDSQLFIEVHPKDLKGLPEDFMKSHPPGKNGKIKITTDYPDAFTTIQYATKEKTRKAIYKKVLSRAYPENEATFKKLLELRHRYATLLGSTNWADYYAQDKMAKNEKTIGEFIDKVADIARPQMIKELKQLVKRKKKDVRTAKHLRIWDRYYYIGKVQSERFRVDYKEVRRYFDYQRVKQGILSISQALFGITFKKIENATVWHKSVEAYDVLENGEVLGRFYLDMHSRQGKFSHASEFDLYSGVTGIQLPSSILACNFPEPTDKGPALMELDDVITFFHEFGHTMHQLLGARHEWVTLSGLKCGLDFAEAPPQLFEEWFWDYDILKQFALHHETGEPIPKELVEKMHKANEFGKNVNTMHQLYLAGLSLNYHNRDPKDIDLLKTMEDMHEKYSPSPYEEGTYIYANLVHLDDYSSMYYVYMWSLVMAKDMFTRFQKEGLMNKDTAMDYRKNVLAPGGSVDAADMINFFLGREYSFDAFKAWLERE